MVAGTFANTGKATLQASRKMRSSAVSPIVLIYVFSKFPIPVGPRAHRSLSCGGLRAAWCLLGLLILAAYADQTAAASFQKEIRPLLVEYCFDCHGDGADKGGVSFDRFSSDRELLAERDLWLHALKNIRAGMMPPAKKPQPTAEQKQLIEAWIKEAVFETDLKNPDPGRVTVRRLNRVEYRNTIRDLLGTDFDTKSAFPPDDSGHGFDNIGDALTLPPMLLEKYLAAAKTIITKVVPSVPKVPQDTLLAGRSFKGEVGEYTRTNHGVQGDALVLSYYENARITNAYKAVRAGDYRLLLDFTANERYVDNVFDYNRCKLVVKVDGREVHSADYGREGGKNFHLEFDQNWKPGEHGFEIEVRPLTPDQKRVRSLSLRVESLTIRGPMDPSQWVRPANYAKFFPGETPRLAKARRKYAREILQPFVTKAYRRPVDAATMDRLVALAEDTYSRSGKTFESGISQAMIAVLASPRFLFREEGSEPGGDGSHPLIDEYSLASRLSYLFWSSMPDDRLFQLAGEGKLRAGLSAEVARMMKDAKSSEFIRNFVGQWLQTRDIETVNIDARQVLNREEVETPAVATTQTNQVAQVAGQTTSTNRPNRPRGFRPLRADLTGDLRRAMRQETEKTFDYILREDRSLLELLDSDYTFLNEPLARHYGLTNLNIVGDKMVMTKLPADSPRGGVITHASVLTVTSNPTRTSPVKRGLFILDNLLGTPPPPPPPDIPPLEDALKAMKEKKLSLRETLALHRESPSCSSCHNRMDPLGLALDNFNAMGMWRDQEKGDRIDASGKLLSGESFSDVRELKKILAANHATEFYRTVTEKLLTYALGRGLEYYDVAAVDEIVGRLQKSNGRPSELVAGIIESAPFQKTRAFESGGVNKPIVPAGQRADARIKP